MKSIMKAFDFAIEPIAITDSNLEDGVKFVYVNASFLKETGYTQEELLGESPKILQGPKSDTKMLAKLKESLLKDEDFKGQTVNYKKDDTPYIVQWSISPLKNVYNKTVAYMSIHKILTKEIDALNDNILFDRIIQQSPQAILVSDLEANIIYTNETFAKNIGYVVEELVGKHTRILKSGKQSPSFYEKMWKGLLADGKFEGIFVSKKKNGSLFYDKKIITLIKDKDSNPKYYMAVCHDVTNIKKALAAKK
jgi:PAS domain S-box-containing protein